MQMLRLPINLGSPTGASACTCAYVRTRFFLAVQRHSTRNAVRNTLSPSADIGTWCIIGTKGMRSYARWTEADGALVAPPDFKSGREAETSPVGSIPSRFRQSFPIGSSWESKQVERRRAAPAPEIMRGSPPDGGESKLLL